VHSELTPASVIGHFVSEAAAHRVQAPVKLLDQDTHAWPLIEQNGDLLLLDEFGDLWWGTLVRTGEARVTRACWPEEARGLAHVIAGSLERLSA
jgi:hypothetical protein